MKTATPHMPMPMGNATDRQIRIHQGRHCRLVSLFYHCHTGHAMFFLVVFLGAVCFSFITYMQISHDCRVVTINIKGKLTFTQYQVIHTNYS